MGVRYLAVAAAVALGSAVAWHEARPLDPREAHVRAEAARLRAHFDAVDAELRARDVSQLGAEQRARRAQLIAWLRDYRNAGEFPLNDRYARSAVPIFRDADGTLCAMAYLIERSGRGDIVDRVARARNTAYIRELADDPELVAWLDEWGLSVAEAARIQPTYEPPPEPAGDVSGDYALASVLLSGTSLVTSWINITEPERSAVVLGFVAGGATMIAGFSRLDENRATRRVAAVNTLIGTAALGAAFYGVLSLRDEERAALRVGAAELRIAPDVIAVADRPRAGVRLTARF